MLQYSSRKNYFGGILSYGIPEFRLSDVLVKKVVKSVLDLGVQARTKCQLGKDISFPPDIGMLIENPAFIDHYTAAQNLKLIANIHRKVGEERIREVLEQVGLGADDPRKYKQFSLGMKQRLGIAGAILEYPALLLIDEPTNALDTDGIEMVRDLLLEQKQRGALVILACHDFSVLRELSDEIYLVREGRVTPYETQDKSE